MRLCAFHMQVCANCFLRMPLSVLSAHVWRTAYRAHICRCNLDDVQWLTMVNYGPILTKAMNTAAELYIQVLSNMFDTSYSNNLNGFLINCVI